MDFAKATYDDLSDEQLERLNVFRNMKPEELMSIKPCWVSEATIKAAFFIDLEKDCIINVSTANLIKSTFLLGLPTNEIFNDDASDLRYVTTLEMWQNKEPVDPPMVSIHDAGQKLVTITDGRHRAILTNYLKVDSVPIVVSKNIAGIITQILS